jgi:hypothetical protein
LGAAVFFLRGSVAAVARQATVRVLLTRGVQGCIIHSVDQQTRNMLAGFGVPALT